MFGDIKSDLLLKFNIDKLVVPVVWGNRLHLIIVNNDLFKAMLLMSQHKDISQMECFIWKMLYLENALFEKCFM